MQRQCWKTIGWWSASVRWVRCTWEVAIVSCDFDSSPLHTNLPSAAITRRKHANHKPTIISHLLIFHDKIWNWKYCFTGYLRVEFPPRPVSQEQVLPDVTLDNSDSNSKAKKRMRCFLCPIARYTKLKFSKKAGWLTKQTKVKRKGGPAKRNFHLWSHILRYSLRIR